MEGDIAKAFYDKQKTAQKIAKILADKNYTIADAEGVLTLVMNKIKLSSIVKCFDLEVKE